MRSSTTNAKMRVIATVVTFNRLQDLKTCIASLRKQTRPFDKIIVVDNGSTDDTAAWLASEEDIQVFRQANLGSAGGSRKALKLAAEDGADLVYLMDDDCIARADTLEKLLSARARLENPDEWILTSLATDPITGQVGPVTIAEEGIPTHPKKMVFSLSDLPQGSISDGIILNWGHFFIGCLVPSQVRSKVGDPRAEYFIRGEDYEYLLRCLRNARVGIVMDSIMLHPMVVHSPPRGKSKLDWKQYCQLRNHMAINREYFPNVRNSPVSRIVKYGVAAFRDLFAGRGFDWLLFYAYKDAITRSFERDIASLRRLH